GEAAESGLRLDIKSEAFRGGDGHGPAVVAGDAQEMPQSQARVVSVIVLMKRGSRRGGRPRSGSYARHLQPVACR
ncbi:MAG: hypothetical protein EBW30_01435, partial [Synechococcaceae bacterium WB7_3xG_012]|nr:hypothetical protein [Synechococcaceae bacterium WB7_3xG_012]